MGVDGPVKWGFLSTANINDKLLPGAEASPDVDPLPTPMTARSGGASSPPRTSTTSSCRRPASLMYVVAVASRDAGRAEAYARERGIERAYGSYEELPHPEVEVAHLAAELHARRVVDPRARGGQARALRKAAQPPSGGCGAGLRRRRGGRPHPHGGLHVPAQPADEAPRRARRGRRHRAPAAGRAASTASKGCSCSTSRGRRSGLRSGKDARWPNAHSRSGCSSWSGSHRSQTSRSTGSSRSTSLWHNPSPGRTDPPPKRSS